MDDASAIQDAMNDTRKAHPDMELRSRLEHSSVARSAKPAREIYLTIVRDDPDNAEGWNKLATCKFRMESATVDDEMML